MKELHEPRLSLPRHPKNVDIPACCRRQVVQESTLQLREAADLFRRAADNGVPDASYQLGRLYTQGLGISMDPVAAFENFLAAANSPVVHANAGENQSIKSPFPAWEDSYPVYTFDDVMRQCTSRPRCSTCHITA